MKRAPQVVAWLAAGLITAPMIGAALGGDIDFQTVGVGLALWGMGLLGALIVGKQPGNRMGWVFVAVGVLAGAVGLADDVDPTPFQHIAGGLAWWTLFFTVVVLIPLLFPAGRVPSRRWRPVLWVAATAMVLYSALWIFQEELCLGVTADGCLEALDNPIGIQGVKNPEFSTIGNVLLSVIPISGVASLGALFVRFRRGHPVERLQVKWLLWAISLFIGWVLLVDIALVEGFGVQIPESVYNLLIGFVWLSLPLAAGVAIFRYRLFEIDRIVSRTAAYALVVMLLAAAYVGTVGIFTLVLPLEGDLSVAAGTLTSAALFSPLRRRTREAVDRRFNRTRYNAGVVVARLSQRLRNVTDLADVTRITGWTINQSVQPTSVAIWVRERGHSPHGLGQ